MAVVQHSLDKVCTYTLQHRLRASHRSSTKSSESSNPSKSQPPSVGQSNTNLYTESRDNLSKLLLNSKEGSQRSCHSLGSRISAPSATAHDTRKMPSPGSNWLSRIGTDPCVLTCTPRMDSSLTTLHTLLSLPHCFTPSLPNALPSSL